MISTNRIILTLKKLKLTLAIIPVLKKTCDAPANSYSAGMFKNKKTIFLYNS